MRVLVTGGAGFIGSYVTKFLLIEGHQVTVVDDLSGGHQEFLDKRAQFIKADISNQTLMEEVLRNHDAVIHMASFIEVGESVKKPVEFARNNILGTISLLEAMRKANVKKLIFSSSACVYGRPKKLPIVESDPLGQQENPYGITKVTMEQFCQLYHNLYNFDVTILRYFNPYGPFELHTPETHAIPNFIKAALSKQAIPLYWKGEQIRDFIYIEDLAKAHIMALPLTGIHFYNVGTESGVKVTTVIEKIFHLIGYKVDIEDKGQRAGDVPALVASSQQIRLDLGWNPQVDLDEGLKRTIDFFKNHLSTSPLLPGN